MPVARTPWHPLPIARRPDARPHAGLRRHSCKTSPAPAPRRPSDRVGTSGRRKHPRSSWPRLRRTDGTWTPYNGDQADVLAASPASHTGITAEPAAKTRDGLEAPLNGVTHSGLRPVPAVAAVVAADPNPHDIAKLGLGWLVTISHRPAVPMFPICSMLRCARPVVESVSGPVKNPSLRHLPQTSPFRG